MTSQCLVVMGVCGSGKSEIGSRLAASLGCRFIEGDDFHPQANRDKMHAGTPLNDDDRRDWLLSLAHELAAAREQGESVVLACSALKRRYRDLLRQGDASLRLVYLRATPHQVATRMLARQGHFMPVELVASQFADLEPPQHDERALSCSVDAAPAQIVESIMVALAA
ncbi:gluconokinase [Paludibacterium purpuratum]|uniref:Gluconokinase n=1 Tax=Paludibacterium purpuratum TaxID=1144873 RepID=A0A4R7B5Q4_9NEIS|nr:gluconokinase [Paludibacterium purpuratum]TDR79931.1 gluconate kinase (SKI family) [Paludibacterium purpuratum]